MISEACSLGVSGTSGFLALVVDPLMAHSRITGVFSTDFFVTADAARTAGLTANNAPAPASVPMNSLLFILSSLADLDGAILVDGDWIARVNGLEKLVAEQIDRDDAPLVPDVTHVETCG